MNKIKHGLGRGLGALLDSHINGKDKEENYVPHDSLNNDDGKSTEVLAKVSVESIIPNPFQPRFAFDSSAMEELKKSILKNGLIQPITVRRKAPKKYELVSGERRLRACKEIGYKEIPAYIIKIESDEMMLALALIENIQREKLNPIEIAQAYKRLMDECGLSPEDIAERVGKDRSTVTNFIRLLKLPKDIQNNLVTEKITAGHARALINLPNAKIQLEMMEKILRGNLSVRKAESFVKSYIKGKDKESAKSSTGSVKNRAHILSQKDLEDKLRKILGTKVICKQKNNGSGEIIIEFYSNDELDRLYEMLESINKYN